MNEPKGKVTNSRKGRAYSESTVNSKASTKFFFKVTRPDGTPFHRGQEINYRCSIGKIVKVVNDDTPKLCTASVIHASEKVLDALSYGQIPCSIFKVSGTPVVFDSTKCGFKQFEVVKEIPVSEFEELLGFKYLEVVNPFDPRTVRASKVTDEDTATLRKWDSVRASVRESVWASVRASEDAYLGTLFPNIKEWKYTEKLPDYAKKGYPFQTCVDLIYRGLIPAYNSYDKIWYLVGYPDGKTAKILWKGKLEQVVELRN